MCFEIELDCKEKGAHGFNFLKFLLFTLAPKNNVCWIQIFTSFIGFGFTLMGRAPNSVILLMVID